MRSNRFLAAAALENAQVGHFFQVTAQVARPLFPVPFWIGKIPAFFVQWLPGAPITVDQILLLQHDNVVSAGAEREHRTLAGLGIAEPRSVETIVPLYLQRYRPQGEFSTGRFSVS